MRPFYQAGARPLSPVLFNDQPGRNLGVPKTNGSQRQKGRENQHLGPIRVYRCVSVRVLA